MTASCAATAALRDSLVLRRLLVLGTAGWETKFTIAALEERGWQVDARVHVAPGVDVVQGRDLMPDTARHAAVIALDGSAARAATAIVNYVRAGGGLVVAGGAADIAAFAALLPGRPGPAVAGRPFAATDTAPRASLAGRSITRLADGAVPIERRGEQVVVAARRIGAGRVVQVGYDDSWRWRLAGEDEPVVAHRAWWARVVAAAAYAPAIALPVAATVPAPYASLVSALGAPSGSVVAGQVDDLAGIPWSAILFGAALVALLAEWAMRRIRGAA